MCSAYQSPSPELQQAWVWGQKYMGWGRMTLIPGPAQPTEISSFGVPATAPQHLMFLGLHSCLSFRGRPEPIGLGSSPYCHPPPRRLGPKGSPGASDTQSLRPVGSRGLFQELGLRAYITMVLFGAPPAALSPGLRGRTGQVLRSSLGIPAHRGFSGVLSFLWAVPQPHLPACLLVARQPVCWPPP